MARGAGSKGTDPSSFGRVDIGLELQLRRESPTID
jgi:hypothetical protein